MMNAYSRDELSNMRREAQEDGGYDLIEPIEPAPAPAKQITWNKDEFNALFMRNPRAVEKAITFLYQRQTFNERQRNTTREVNGRGFTAFDAEFLSSLGAKLAKGMSLSEGQLVAVRRPNKAGYCILAKYHGQLLEAVAIKERAKVYAEIDRVEATQ